MKYVTRRLLCLLVSGIMMFSLCACSKETEQAGQTSENESEQTVEAVTVNGTPAVYVTTPDEMYKFVRQEDDAIKVYDASELDKDSGWVIEVDPNAKLQTVDGWGAHLSGSTAENLAKLSEDEQDKVLKSLFSADEGIGLNMLRQALGYSDFYVNYQSYDEIDGDVNLEHFDFSYDEENIIPYVKKAQEFADNDLTFVSTIWTAPRWMKTIPEYHSQNGAMLKREYYETYANYIVKTLQAHEDAGVHVDYLSAQNEVTGKHPIPATYYDADAYSTFINQYLAPAIEKSGLNTNLITWDFNHFGDAWDFISKTYDNTDVIAFHIYYIDWELQKEIAETFPDKPIWMTESSNRATNGAAVYMSEMKRIAQSLRNHASAYFLFNIMLDQNGGPAEDVSFSLPAGLLEYNTETGQVSYRMDFYAMGHYSKFIRRGAVILDTLDTGVENEDNIQNIVALNKNGAMTIVLTNNDAEDQTFKFLVGDKVVEYTVPAKSGATITWDANVY